MFIALSEYGKKVEIDNVATGKNYFCPLCNEKLIVKNKGRKVRHYFAHRPNSKCHDWGDMSEWHREWQGEFPIECREAVMENDGEFHRADVKIGNYVIEFQHSPITYEEFVKRNKFYTKNGCCLIWIIDAEGKIKDIDKYSSFSNVLRNDFIRPYYKQELSWSRSKLNHLSIDFSVDKILVLLEVFHNKLNKKVLIPVIKTSDEGVITNTLSEYIFKESFLNCFLPNKYENVKNMFQIVYDSNCIYSNISKTFKPKIRISIPHKPIVRRFHF